MIYYKTSEEIEGIRKSCLLVSRTLAEVAKIIRPGTSTLKIDKLVEEFIRDHGAIPSFLGYRDFPNAACVSVNDAVVHGIPANYELKEGDIVSVDCGATLGGYVGDSAFTFAVGEISDDKRRLLEVTRESLNKAIEAAKVGNRLGDISYAVQEHVERNGYSVVRELVGHGVGKSLHEDPEVPNYGKRGHGLKLQDGLVIAIEPMVNMGRKEVFTADDNWTVYTRDRKPSAHFEHTVAVRKSGPDVLTTFKFIEEEVFGMAV
ncbi:MAG: type I methionyl aminopeptidase [Chitinophagales bacterium]|nr:type I methionyl aminopeptidase [Bacteroidota bacterium]MBX7139928.1 type I methionyl aminopeptidase [Chitinophagales bacterium]